jgi:hypothetical protein
MPCAGRMSDPGTKRTSAATRRMSACEGRADLDLRLRACCWADGGSSPCIDLLIAYQAFRCPVSVVILASLIGMALFVRAGAAVRRQRRRPLQILRPEAFAIFARVRPGDHEHAVAPVVQRARIFGRRRHMGLHDLQDKQAVGLDQARID